MYLSIKIERRTQAAAAAEDVTRDSSSDSDSDANDEYLAAWVAQSDPQARLVRTHQVATADKSSTQGTHSIVLG